MAMGRAVRRMRVGNKVIGHVVSGEAMVVGEGDGRYQKVPAFLFSDEEGNIFPTEAELKATQPVNPTYEVEGDPPPPVRPPAPRAGAENTGSSSEPFLSRARQRELKEQAQRPPRQPRARPQSFEERQDPEADDQPLPAWLRQAQEEGEESDGPIEGAYPTQPGGPSQGEAAGEAQAPDVETADAPGPGEDAPIPRGYRPQGQLAATGGGPRAVDLESAGGSGAVHDGGRAGGTGDGASGGPDTERKGASGGGRTRRTAGGRKRGTKGQFVKSGGS